MLRERNAVERWLREDVVVTYDAMRAQPEQVILSTDVDRRMRARHEARLKRDA